MEKELLPIGSVVQLANSTGLVMVAGYLPIQPSRPDHVWDYSGFKFPIGFTGNELVYCFDHEQIQVVYAYGYKDIEEDLFMKKLMSKLQEKAGAARAGQPGEKKAEASQEQQEPEKPEKEG